MTDDDHPGRPAGRPSKSLSAPRSKPPEDPPPAETGLALAVPTDHARAVEQLLRWIAKGASDIEQAEGLATHYPTADPRLVYQQALAQIERLATPGAVMVRGFAFLSAQELYRHAFQSGDLAAALRCLKFLVELGELAPPPAADDAPPPPP